MQRRLERRERVLKAKREREAPKRIREIRRALDYIAKYLGAIEDDGTYVRWRQGPDWPTQLIAVWRHLGEYRWGEVCTDEQLAEWMWLPRNEATPLMIDAVHAAKKAALGHA